MRKILFSFLLMFVTLGINAQTEPDFEFEPFVFAITDSTFNTPLPCENAYVRAKAGASVYLTGLGKIKSYYYIDGAASSLSVDKKNYIIINTGGHSPMQTLSIIKLEEVKSKRRWQTGEVGSFTGASAGKDNGTTLKYKKYGKDSVLLSLAALEPGEYVLAVTNMMTNSKSAKVYTFRIEGAVASQKQEMQETSSDDMLD